MGATLDGSADEVVDHPTAGRLTADDYLVSEDSAAIEPERYPPGMLRVEPEHGGTPPGTDPAIPLAGGDEGQGERIGETDEAEAPAAPDWTGDAAYARAPDTVYSTPLVILKTFADGEWRDVGRGPLRIVTDRAPSRGGGARLIMHSGLTVVLNADLGHEAPREAGWEKVRERTVRFVYPLDGSVPRTCVLQFRDADTAARFHAVLTRLMAADGQSAEPAAPADATVRADAGVEHESDAALAEVVLTPDDGWCAVAQKMQLLLEELADTVGTQDEALTMMERGVADARERYLQDRESVQAQWSAVRERLVQFHAYLDADRQAGTLEALCTQMDARFQTPAHEEMDTKPGAEDDIDRVGAARQASMRARPQSFADFCRRLCTFREACVQLARHGWYSRDVGIVHCGRCDAEVSIGTDTPLEAIQHRPECPWTMDESPPRFGPGAEAETEGVWRALTGDVMRLMQEALQRASQCAAQLGGPEAVRTLAQHGWQLEAGRRGPLLGCMYCGATASVEASLVVTGECPSPNQHRYWCLFARDAFVALCQDASRAATMDEA
eukprot:ctg_603.g274